MTSRIDLERNTSRQLSVTIAGQRNRLAVELAVRTGGRIDAELERYAAMHARAYGEPVDAVALIPHMLEAFMARDRGFRRAGLSRAVPQK